MQKILFATTNQNKIAEARAILGIDIEGVGIEGVLEIQSLNVEDVAIKKAKDYFGRLKQPVVVEDTSIIFNALGRLPGPYFKDFHRELGNEGIITLLNSFDDRSAVAKTTVVFVDSKGKEHTFSGEVKGEVTKQPKGEKGFGWDPIFKPEYSDKTYGEMEMDEKNKFSTRKIAFLKMKKWMKENLVD